MNTISSLSVPRIESLHHRLQTAKGPDGEPLGLLDDLMVFLEDPPPDSGDRWKAGVELCAEHGIVTSRAAVWRFYREHVVQWRLENAPSLGKVPEAGDTRLAEQARQLLSLRAVENLRHPHLPPRVLIGLVQSENRRQELQLARDKFDEQLFLRERENERQRLKVIENERHDRASRAVWARLQRGEEIGDVFQAVADERAAQAASPSAPKAKP